MILRTYIHEGKLTGLGRQLWLTFSHDNQPLRVVGSLIFQLSDFEPRIPEEGEWSFIKDYDWHILNGKDEEVVSFHEDVVEGEYYCNLIVGRLIWDKLQDLGFKDKRLANV